MINSCAPALQGEPKEDLSDVAPSETKALNKPRTIRYPPTTGKIDELMMDLISIKKRQYLQEFRMSQKLFHLLEAPIKNHPLLHKNFNVPQRLVQDHLMVTLSQIVMIMYVQRQLECMTAENRSHWEVIYCQLEVLRHQYQDYKNVTTDPLRSVIFTAGGSAG
ncbi:uncharacterized protein VP01_3084g1 [Puccinia sorghi]|uniref:Uncharacterized protein n=1 Tax=Puccinia sorghi TaxID=27349 RepID=A0A0L6UZR5_9BASI|nr:uncharacterized protein VP01_3084g1 [Puccinia sorghi]